MVIDVPYSVLKPIAKILCVVVKTTLLKEKKKTTMQIELIK